MSKYIKSRISQDEREFSNGQTALKFFDNELQENHLYLLDEPENSLSPKFQLELKELIQELARYFNCQFIIATHSLFMLGILNVKIYNLDTKEYEVQKWNELDNVKYFYKFFKDREGEF